MALIVAKIRKAISNPEWLRTSLARRISFPNGPMWRAMAALRVFMRRLRVHTEADDAALLFCYDLALNPITFDFVEFLTQAEVRRRESNLRHMDALIVFNDHDDVVPRDVAYLSGAVTHEQRLFRINELLLGSCRLIQTVRNVYVSNRSGASAIVERYKFVYPEKYHTLSPVACSYNAPATPAAFFPMLVPPPYAVKLMREYLDRFSGKRIITITLREYGYLTERNSDIGAWLAFAKSLPSIYQVIFIPDASTYASEFRDRLRGFEVLDAVCWNVALRAALYRLSWINLGVAGGPMIISLYQEEANTLFFINGEVYPTSYWNHLERFFGDEVGTKKRFLRPNNHYVYQADNLEAISEEFWKLDRCVAARPSRDCGDVNPRLYGN